MSKKLSQSSYNPPEVEPDGVGSDSYTFSLPKTRIPEPVMKGVRGHRTRDGYLVLRIHYSCDPDRATEEWLEEQVIGYPGGIEGSKWQREMEIDFGSFAGTPIYERFDATLSVKQVKYNPLLPLWRGWDFGYRNPACTWWQLWEDDTLVQLHELFPTLDKEKNPGMTTGEFANLVMSETARLFPQALDKGVSEGIFDFVDPAGTQKKETSEMSSVEMLHTKGIIPEHSVVGRKTRIAYLRQYIEGRHKNGKPKFLVNPHCHLSIKAYEGGYRRPPEGKGTSDPDMPDLSQSIQKEPYIHLIDSGEYMAACNLQIEHPTPVHNRPEPERKVDDLASVYLGATANLVGAERTVPTDRRVSTEDAMELMLSDLIGEDTLEDAWEIY